MECKSYIWKCIFFLMIFFVLLIGPKISPFAAALEIPESILIDELIAPSDWTVGNRKEIDPGEYGVHNIDSYISFSIYASDMTPGNEYVLWGYEPTVPILLEEYPYISLRLLTSVGQTINYAVFVPAKVRIYFLVEEDGDDDKTFLMPFDFISTNGDWKNFSANLLELAIENGVTGENPRIIRIFIQVVDNSPIFGGAFMRCDYIKFSESDAVIIDESIPVSDWAGICWWALDYGEFYIQNTGAYTQFTILASDDMRRNEYFTWGYPLTNHILLEEYPYVSARILTSKPDEIWYFSFVLARTRLYVKVIDDDGHAADIAPFGYICTNGDWMTYGTNLLELAHEKGVTGENPRVTWVIVKASEDSASTGIAYSFYDYIRFFSPSINEDADSDGLSDCAEASIYGTDPFAEDTDGDNISDGQEIDVWGTDPLNEDSDGDGLSDYEEVYIWGTDPLVTDTDGDLNSDYLEVVMLGTDPLSTDSDDDGISDTWELKHGIDPLIDDAAEDPDWDALTNYEEYMADTHPKSKDTDMDGLWDYYEAKCGVANNGWQDPLEGNKRYALLIAGGYQPVENFVSFWNALVDMYDVLINDYGYADEDVYVLYADGNPISTENCPSHIENIGSEDENRDGIPDDARGVDLHRNMIDGPATDAVIKDTFTTLSNRMRDTDFLLIMVASHGGYVDNNHNDMWDDGEEATLSIWSSPEIRSSVFAGNEYVGKIEDYARMVLILDFCYVGGFWSDLSHPKRVVYTSNIEGREGSSSDNVDGYARLPFCYYFTKAFQVLSGNLYLGTAGYHEETIYNLADADHNRFVSFHEAFQYCRNNNPNFSYDIDWHVENDPGEIAETTYL